MTSRKVSALRWVTRRRICCLVAIRRVTRCVARKAGPKRPSNISRTIDSVRSYKRARVASRPRSIVAFVASHQVRVCARLTSVRMSRTSTRPRLSPFGHWINVSTIRSQFAINFTAARHVTPSHTVTGTTRTESVAIWRTLTPAYKTPIRRDVRPCVPLSPLAPIARTRNAFGARTRNGVSIKTPISPAFRTGSVVNGPPSRRNADHPVTGPVSVSSIKVAVSAVMIRRAGGVMMDRIPASVNVCREGIVARRKKLSVHLIAAGTSPNVPTANVTVTASVATMARPACNHVAT